MFSTHKSRHLVTLLVLVIGVMLVTSCAPAAPTPAAQAPAAQAPAAQPAAQQASKEPLVFGVVGPMTGDAADYGTMLQTGVNLAVDEINAAGGIAGRQVKIEVCDDKCQPDQGSLCAQRMVANASIFAVIGHVCSSCTLAAGPIYEKAGLTAMTVSSTNPEVTAKGWKHIFRTIPHDGMQGPLMAQFAIQTLAKKKLAIIYGNNDYGKGLLDRTTPEVTKMGGQLVATETYNPGVDKDFSAQLTKIAKAGPEALLLLTDYTEGGLIAKQRVTAGLKDIPLIASAGNQHEDFIKLGSDGAEGAYVMVYFDPGKPDKATQDFVKAYQAKYNKMPSEQAGYGYEAPYIFKQAIEKGATKDTMNDVLRTVDYVGLTGETKFDATGDVSGKGQAILTVKAGKFASYVK